MTLLRPHAPLGAIRTREREIAQTIDEYSQDNTVDPGLLQKTVKMKVREVLTKYGSTKKTSKKRAGGN